MSDLKTSYLRELESEAIFILREVIAQFSNPVILFSGGKDSILLIHLMKKAVWPSRLSVPLLHIDTGHNFDETIEYRDKLVKEYDLTLLIGSVQEAIDEGIVHEEKTKYPSRNKLQTEVLLHALDNSNFDVAIGGGRRDEEKARAKERIFSQRDEFGQWDPKNQRPELWNLFNGRINQGEHFRVFPLSNWTELDVWQYIDMEHIELPSLYFSHTREVIEDNGVILAHGQHTNAAREKEVTLKQVRCRTIGDTTCTGLWSSTATSVNEIIKELEATRLTERGGRADDKVSDTSMEDRKRLGYF